MSAIILRPMPVIDTTSAEAAPFLARLNSEQAITSLITPGTWLTRIFGWRTTGELSLTAAAYLTGYILEQGGLRSLGPLWARLALVDWLGRVDTSPLTAGCINRIISDLDSFYHQAQTKGAPTMNALTRYVQSRQPITLKLCGSGLEPYFITYQRALAALRIFYD